MLKIIMMQGLQGSGKTTWALNYIKQHPEFKRINNDSLREMLDGGAFSKEREKYIDNIRLDMIAHAIKNGHSVIIDNMNLSPKHEQNYRQMANILGCEFEVKSFLDIPLHVCIERDSKREKPIGSKVIYQLWRQFVEPNIIKPMWNPNKDDAIICDLDGTLAIVGNRNPYDRDFENDEPNMPVLGVIKRFIPDYKIIFTSGRKNDFVDGTVWFLVNRCGLEPREFELYMRNSDDNRPDNVVKLEMYEKYIKPFYNVAFVIDDRPQVVRQWKQLGLFVFNVGDSIEF